MFLKERERERPMRETTGVRVKREVTRKSNRVIFLGSISL